MTARSVCWEHIALGHHGHVRGGWALKPTFIVSAYVLCSLQEDKDYSQQWWTRLGQYDTG